jgi:endonuclease/exonuclease/phosphatase (EEP) superfamily protein YafD
MSLFFPILSLLLWIVVATCYLLRPISCAAVTVFPTWLWLVPGLLLAGLGWRRGRLAGAVGGLWLLFLLGFAEEPWSLLRGTIPARHESPTRVIRIVSLNCAGGSLEAAREVKRYQPDIVLLQESPSRDAVQQLARELFGEEGGWAHGPDASIIARGNVQPYPLSRDEKIFLTHARVTLTDGKPMEVIGLRLSPPTVRADLWSPDCWRQHAEVRRFHHEQIKAVMRRIEQIPLETPVIVGGDFNMPPGEAPLRLLQKRLRDSFRLAGAGWGCTITNEYPFHRIDQIWLSPHLRPTRVRAYRTQHSDHRLVVCDALQ